MMYWIDRAGDHTAPGGTVTAGSRYKIYVNVGAEFTPEGFLRPLWIRWSDGRTFQIDRVLHCQRAASLKAGGTGLRYTCMIGGKEHYLFYEDNYRWFVEGK